MKPIPNFGNYFVSSSGKICNKNKFLSPYVDKQGHQCITLRQDGRKKNFRVFMLVAEAYCKNPHSYLIVIHINDDKLDNSVTNLKWVKGCRKETPVRTKREKEIISERSGKTILEFDNYSVTPNGKVYNKKGEVLSTFADKRRGYQLVTLQQNGEKKDPPIHRLVAQAYVLNPNEYKFVKHLDGDIVNNTADNLVWVKERYEMRSETIYKLPEDLNFNEIPDFPRYFITNDGMVYSLKTGKYIKKTEANGYYTVVLYIDNKQYHKHVHKLVAQTYLTKKDKDVCVNHKNGNKKDNRVENLEWCTKSHDVKHALSTGLNPGRKRAVVQIRVKYRTKYKEMYPSLAKASKATGINAGAICTSCQERTLIGAGRKATRSGKVYKFRYRSYDSNDVMAREIFVR